MSVLSSLPCRLDLVDDPAGVVVGVLGEAGEDFHQAALERLLVLGDRIPGSHRGGARRELRVLRNPALGLGACEDALAILVPAVVELALILVGPFLHDLVRAVRCARRPIHEERLVRCVGLLFAEPLDRVRRDVVGEVVALGLLFGDRGGVARQGRFILRGLAGEEAVEVLEAVAGRPVVERPLGRDLLFGRVVPLAPGPGVVAVVLEHFGDGRRRLRDGAAEAVEVVGDRRDLAVADAGVIAPGEQRGPRGRAHGRGVEAIEGDAHLRHAIERRRVDLAAVGRGRARPHVVHQDDEDVRRALGQTLRLDAFLVDGILHRQPRGGGGRRGWERQDFLCPRRRREQRAQREAEGGRQWGSLHGSLAHDVLFPDLEPGSSPDREISRTTPGWPRDSRRVVCTVGCSCCRKAASSRNTAKVSG